MSDTYAGRHRPAMDRHGSTWAMFRAEQDGLRRDNMARWFFYNYRPIHTPLTEAQIAYWNATGERGDA